jgi:hypothetical protein
MNTVTTQPLFVQLGDQMINMSQVHFMREIKDSTAPADVSVAIDMGVRTFTWTPKTKAEIEWLREACQVMEPGQTPKPEQPKSEGQPRRNRRE